LCYKEPINGSLKRSFLSLVYPELTLCINPSKVTVFCELDKYKCLFLAVDDSSTKNSDCFLEGMVLPTYSCDYSSAASLPYN
jgi:hypothetical protein